MGITVLYFAVARERAGTGEEAIAPTPGDVGALRARLVELHPALAPVLPRCRVAVGQEFADDAAPLRDGAEVAVIPPVSGGAGRCRLVDRPLVLAEVVDAVAGPDRGGVVTFTGVVRAQAQGRPVLRLEVEAYAAMAEAHLERIAAEIERETGAAVAVAHRVGALAPGEATVVVACAASHRGPAFRACEAAIDRLKRDLPVWKREVFADGSEWVGAGP